MFFIFSSLRKLYVDINLGNLQCECLRCGRKFFSLVVCWKDSRLLLLSRIRIMLFQRKKRFQSTHFTLRLYSTFIGDMVLNHISTLKIYLSRHFMASRTFAFVVKGLVDLQFGVTSHKSRPRDEICSVLDLPVRKPH